MKYSGPPLPQVDISHLKTFLLLAETGDLPAAAALADLSTSTLLQHITRLEQLFSFPLFHRAGNNIELTYPGKKKLYRIREFIKKVEGFHYPLVAADPPASGRLVIGTESNSEMLTAAGILGIQKHIPGCLPSVIRESSADIIEKTLSGEVSVGFVRRPVPLALKSHKLGETTLVLCVKENVAAVPRNPTPADIHLLFQRVPLIRISDNEDPGLVRQIDSWMQAAGVPPANVQYVSSSVGLFSALINGRGMIFTTGNLRLKDIDNIRLIPLSGEYAATDIMLVWNPEIPDPVRDKFIDCYLREGGA